MNSSSKLEPILLDARMAFYSGDLMNSYALFRRAYDRLPFQFDRNHAQFIGPFARLLWELGREDELRFYEKEFSRWLSENPFAEMRYASAVCQLFLEEPNLDKAKALLEGLIKKKDADLEPFIQRARVMLVYYHSRRNELKKALDYLEPLRGHSDEIIQYLVDLWTSNILRRRGKIEESLTEGEKLLERLKGTPYWYLQLVTKLELSRGYLDLGQFRKSESYLKNLDSSLKQRSLKRIGAEVNLMQEFLKMAEKAKSSQSRMWI